MNWITKKLNEVAKIDRHSISPENIHNGSLYVGLEHITSEGSFTGVEPVRNGELSSSKFKFSHDHLARAIAEQFGWRVDEASGSLKALRGCLCRAIDSDCP